MHAAYDTKHSDNQILPIPTESSFPKFNAHQSYALYSIKLFYCLGLLVCTISVSSALSKLN